MTAGVGGDQQDELKVDLLQPGKYQPRTRMDEAALKELADSIKVQGVMQPILVRPVGGGRYEAWSPGWFDYCQNRYRSFNSRTGYYRGYDGQDHFCVVP